MHWPVKFDLRLNHYYYIDSVIRGYHVYKDFYIGEVLQCRSDAHNHRNSLAFYRLGSEGRNVHSFEVFQQRHRIKKSQARRNYDTCRELKRKCSRVTAELKFANPQRLP